MSKTAKGGSKKELKIRRAKRADALQIAVLAGQLGYPATTPEMRKRLLGIKPASLHAVFVADAPEDGVIGWVHVSKQPLLEVEIRAEVNGLVVAEGQRGLGAGARLLAAAELAGVPRSLVPSSVPALDLYIASVRPTLRCTPAAAESMAYLLDPPGMDEDTAEIWQDVRDAAIAVLPRWARQMYGYDAPPPLTPGRRTEIRQSLGVLDAMFLGQPGVLEARQRITLRMRGARRT